MADRRRGFIIAKIRLKINMSKKEPLGYLTYNRGAGEDNITEHYLQRTLMLPSPELILIVSERSLRSNPSVS